MAYKFQLGNAIMSGSLTQKEGLNAGDDGLSNAGAIAGATTITATGIISSSADVKAAQLYIQDTVVIDNLADVYVNNINGNGTLSLNDGTNTVSNTELLILSGATVTTAELNILDNADPSINSLSLPDNTTITTFAASILDDADEATFKATVNLEIGTDVQAYDADLDTLSGMQSGAPAALALLTSAEIALLDGASSSNNTASKAVVLDGSGNLTLDGDLIVLGSTFSASVGTLLIEDALINIGDGQASYADGYGIEFGTSGSSWASLKTAQVNSANHLSSSLPLAASSFYGDGSNLTNVSATGLEETVQSISSTGTINMNSGLQILVDVSAGGFTLTLPSAGSVEGKILKIKKKNNSTNVLTLDTASGNIDGASSIQLESGFAAVNIISDGTDFYVI